MNLKSHHKQNKLQFSDVWSPKFDLSRDVLFADRFAYEDGDSVMRNLFTERKEFIGPIYPNGYLGKIALQYYFVMDVWMSNCSV